MLKSLIVPNYTLYAVLSLMIVTAAVLNFTIIPDKETLFVPFFMWEFFLAFFASMALVIGYDLLRPSETKAVIKLYHAMFAFAGMYGVISLFATMKSVIHHIQPYNIDGWLLSLEKVIHFGFLPTTLINHMIEWEGLYDFLDVIYMAWFFWIYIYASLVVLSNPYDQLRERFVFCFAGVWFFIGNIAAGVFASVGPIFLEGYFNPAISSDSMSVVSASANIFDEESVERGYFAALFKGLITEYESNNLMVDPNAPSAMPSVHVAMAALLMFHASHGKRWAFVASILFLGIIFAGSVLLAWHYAIDGYVAVILTYALWRLSAFLPVLENLRN
jgi:hypothetical protein